MLKTLIARAGLKPLFDASRQASSQAQLSKLAKVPASLDHVSGLPRHRRIRSYTLTFLVCAVHHQFGLDSLYERPVQTELTELLLLSKADERFTSCVVVHGMGGSGKVSRPVVL